ncbi:MAG: hypothetical protein WD749_05865 [Phycisphaerales bacterium]
MPAARPNALAIALLGLLAPGAVAQVPAAPPGVPDATAPHRGPPSAEVPALSEVEFIPLPWRVQVEPSLWFTAPGGYIQLPGGPGRVRVDEFNLDSPHASPYVEAHVRRGDWRLAFSAMTYSAENRSSTQAAAGSIGGIPFAAGDRIRASLDFTSFHMEMAYRMPFSGRFLGNPEPDLLTIWETTAGVRFHLLDVDLELPGGHAGGREFVGAPYVGVRLSMEVIRSFTIDGTVNIALYSNGNDVTFSGSDIVIGMSYRPVKNFGVQVGYRQIAADLSSGTGLGELRWEEGAFAGVFAGVMIRF